MSFCRPVHLRSGELGRERKRKGKKERGEGGRKSKSYERGASHCSNLALKYWSIEGEEWKKGNSNPMNQVIKDTTPMVGFLPLVPSHCPPWSYAGSMQGFQATIEAAQRPFAQPNLSS